MAWLSARVHAARSASPFAEGAKQSVSISRRARLTAPFDRSTASRGELSDDLEVRDAFRGRLSLEIHAAAANQPRMCVEDARGVSPNAEAKVDRPPGAAQ